MATRPKIYKSGKHDDVIIYEHYGELCMRSKPQKVYNPKTPEQMKGRNQFGATSKFASAQLKTLIYPFWNPVAKKNKRTGYNYFVQSNLPAFKNGMMTAEKLILIPKNKLALEKFVIENLGNRIRLSWESALVTPSARKEDELCLLILSDGKELNLSNNIAKRGDHQVVIEHKEVEVRHYFVFWKRNDYWSESRFLFAINS